MTPKEIMAALTGATGAGVLAAAAFMFTVPARFAEYETRLNSVENTVVQHRTTLERMLDRAGTIRRIETDLKDLTRRQEWVGEVIQAWVSDLPTMVCDD